MNRPTLPGLLLVIAVGAACGSGNHRAGDLYTSASQGLTVCPAGGTVRGIDVSSYQGTIDWTLVAGSGVQFAFAKASEGLTVVDSEFPSYWPAMKSAGVLRGAYHFFHPGDDGTAQADFFLAQVGPLGAPGDLPPMLDWEVTDSSTTAESIAAAQAFIAEIKLKTGLQTGIYTSARVWDLLSDPTQFSAAPLWVANWTGSVSNCPTIPDQWTNWLFWQWNDAGTTPGITTQDPDLNVFNGTLTQLQQLASGTPTFTPPAQASGNESITLLNWPDSHQELFARTPAGTELHSATSGTNDTWSSPAALDTGALCGSAASFGGGSWDTPVLMSPLTSGTAGELSWSSAAGWGTWLPFGGAGLSHFSSTVTNDGRPEVFALGSDHFIWTRALQSSSGTWSDWQSLGGSVSFATGVGAITWGNGTVEIFGTDTTGMGWHMWSDSTGSSGWSAWTAFGGGTLSSRPVPVRWADGTDGHAEVFARGTDGQLYHSDFSYTSDWPGFTVVSAGSQIIGEPSAIMNPGDAGDPQGPEIFARDPTGQVVHVAWDGTAYGTFEAVGTQISASDPFGWVRPDGAGEVFAIDSSGDLVHRLRDPVNGWTAWSTIGNGFDPCSPDSAALGPDGGLAPDDAGTVTVDGGTDGAPRSTPSTGCACSPDRGTPISALIWLAALGLARGKRRRAATLLRGGA